MPTPFDTTTPHVSTVSARAFIRPFSWITAWMLFLGGSSLLFLGFWCLRHPGLCAIDTMILGMMPCLAGGYHAYRLEIHTSTRQRFAWERCAVVYGVAVAVEYATLQGLL
jgi:hypothetical protein